MFNDRTNKVEHINIMEHYAGIKSFIYNQLLANYELGKYSRYVEQIKQVIYYIISRSIF